MRAPRNDRSGITGKPSAQGMHCAHTLSISDSLFSSGEMPPCTQKNFPSSRAATGRAWNDRMHASYTFAEYLCRHSRLKVKYSVRCLHSWLPRSRKRRSGYQSLRA